MLLSSESMLSELKLLQTVIVLSRSSTNIASGGNKQIMVKCFRLRYYLCTTYFNTYGDLRILGLTVLK